MKDFEFFIFGVPNGFNMHNSTSEDLSFFETYYDSSKEKVKFNIQKKTNGYVVYTYLRYLMLSAPSGSEGGRGNSFFGMSIRFKDHYCNDPMRLYKLLDKVYLEMILKDESILRELPENKNNLQAQFVISKFSDVDSYIEKIRKVIANNLETKFASNFFPLSNDKNKTQKNISVKLHSDKSSEQVNQAFEKYSNINISPDFIETKTPKITEEEIDDLERSAVKLRNLSLQLFSNITQKNYDWNTQFIDLKKVYENKRNILLNFPNNERIKKLKPHYDQIAKSIKELHKLNIQLTSNPNVDNDNPVVSYTWLEHLQQSFIIAPLIFKTLIVVSLPLIFFTGYFLGRPNSETKTSCEKCEEIINEIQLAIDSKKFTDAKSLISKLDSLEQDVSEYNEMLDNAKIEFYLAKADSTMKETINCTSGEKMIDSYNAARKIIMENIISIDKEQAELKIKELESKAVDYYFDCYEISNNDKKVKILETLESNFSELKIVSDFIEYKKININPQPVNPAPKKPIERVINKDSSISVPQTNQESSEQKININNDAEPQKKTESTSQKPIKTESTNDSPPKTDDNQLE
jgi:hypothetical protein